MMMHILAGSVVGIVAVGFLVFSFVAFLRGNGEASFLAGIACLMATLGAAGAFLST